MLFFWITLAASAVRKMPVHIALLALLIQSFDGMSLKQTVMQLLIQHVLLRLIR